jgi:hypothetical protein
LQLAARHPHIGPHGESTGHGPGGGGEIDVGGEGKIFSDERLGPVPGAPGRQTNPTRRLGLEECRRHLQGSYRDAVAVDRQIDRHLAAIERDEFRHAVGPTDRQL